MDREVLQLQAGQQKPGGAVEDPGVEQEDGGDRESERGRDEGELQRERKFHVSLEPAEEDAETESDAEGEEE